uniref:CRISPR-associated endoribonuclease Cas2 n=1 Tax=Thermodesulfobacterium geofontis TaxID=1295609 RepID=A0A7V4N4E7_9BACT
MDYLIVYDISDHKKRLKVARILQKFGYRIQYSAFYLPETKGNVIDFLFKEIFKLVDKRTDRVFFYPVHPPEIFKGYPLEPWKIFII